MYILQTALLVDTVEEDTLAGADGDIITCRTHHLSDVSIKKSHILNLIKRCLFSGCRRLWVDFLTITIDLDNAEVASRLAND